MKEWDGTRCAYKQPAKPKAEENCWSLHPTDIRARACCEAAKSGEATWLAPSNTCKCNDSMKEWDGTRCAYKQPAKPKAEENCWSLHPTDVKARACCEAAKSGEATWLAPTNTCKCNDSMKEWDGTRCAYKKPEDKKKDDKKDNNSGKKTGFCEQFNNIYPERYACCIMGKNTEWSTNDPANGQCICKIKNTKWQYSDGVGICKNINGGNGGNGGNDGNGGGNDNGNDGATPPYQTPEQTHQCWYSFNADVRCANGASISKSSGFYVDTKMANCEEFTALYQSDKSFILEMAEKYCRLHPELPIIDDKAFNAAKDSLNSFFSSAKSSASVWKNSEGKFNTARLASDLTAGVILGTVGGVVSGVVIKKKQVEKGFEALHCTVGGQKVADWGDEFNIGFRR
jgi:hypothetical protein